MGSGSSRLPRVLDTPTTLCPCGFPRVVAQLGAHESAPQFSQNANSSTPQIRGASLAFMCRIWPQKEVIGAMLENLKDDKE